MTTADGLTVPYMVDATRTPVDFTLLDADHVARCARETRCGVCGRKIRRGPIAFIGPADGRTCYADPWLHPTCAELAMQRCPFLSGRRDWSSAEAREDPLLAPYSTRMAVVLARSWRCHRDARGAWHFEAVGPLARAEIEPS